MNSIIPEKVIVTASGDFKCGLAVRLKFSMSRKNDYFFTAFLDERGKAEISKTELLRSFDADRNLFLMDYIDPRVAFTGQITAHVLNKAEITKSINARGMFKKYPYPENYFENLKTALAITQDEGKTVVIVEQFN